MKVPAKIIDATVSPIIARYLFYAKSKNERIFIFSSVAEDVSSAQLIFTKWVCEKGRITRSLFF
jgi:hypothetical protein